ncbi:MAG: hypothetical protein ACOYL5_09645 [Phototrophicaceae bacterium]
MPKQQKTVTTPLHTAVGTTTVGLDVGYGATKVVTDNTKLIFTSVMGHATDLGYQEADIKRKHPGDVLVDDDGEWFVGDLALQHLRSGDHLQLRGRTSNEDGAGNAFRLRLAKVALGKLFMNVSDGDVLHLRLATGLPVDHMADAAELKRVLLGQHRIKTDTADFIANISEVFVMPQPMGTLYSQMLTDAGQINRHHTAVRTGVADVGRFSVDISLDDDGEFVRIESGSVEAGVYTVHERIGQILEQDHRQKFSIRFIEETLRNGTITIAGQPMAYHRQVEEALEPLRNATLNLMREKWGAAKTVDVIYLSGGGAELVYDQVVDEYPQTILIPDAQFANARGYLNFAHFKAQA